MFRLVRLCVLGLVAVLATPAEAVVGGDKAAAPEPDAAVVFLQRYGRSARLEGIKNDKLGYYSFMGIRYAEPPVGSRRFQRPVRRFLAGEMNVTSNCNACPQPHPFNPETIIGDEDCLCINVFAPKMPGEETGCPVIFYIHGGNYRSGSAAPYGGQHLAQKDTILVTVQYRLGSLGYFSTGQKDASGNVGLFDLRAAMKWVADYIEFFGGDPKRVVIMGHGSGGSAASLLALADEGPITRGVAALSGAPLSPGAVRPDSDPKQHAEQLAARTRCPASPAESLVACLRTRSVADIVQADRHITMALADTEAFLAEMSGRTGVGVRVEGSYDYRGLPPLITDQPGKSIAKNKKLSPLLTGVTSAETSRAVFGTYSKFLESKLNKVKDFIKKDIIGGLRDALHSVPNLIEVLPPGITPPPPLADFYQTIFASTSNVIDGLLEIAQATNDALFNFPAYQSTRAWSENGDAYLYSFEHVGNLSKGSHFLPGLALTENSEVYSSIQKKLGGPAHGDELAYIFEPLNEDGFPIDDRVSDADVRVRESFVSLLAKFAHDLRPLEQKSSTDILGLIPISKKNDQYIKIASGGISVDKDFRFCQMGLWGNMASRLTTSVCKTKVLNTDAIIIKSILEHKPPSNLALGPQLGSGLPINVPLKPANRGNSQAGPRKPTSILNPFGL